jgi:hypothetical protein
MIDNEFWANMCFNVHMVILFFMMTGYFIPTTYFPVLSTFHHVFNVVAWSTYFLLGLNCPLTMMENYLRLNGNPTHIYKEPFITRMLREKAGLTIPEILIVISFVLVVMFCVICVITYICRKNSQY